MIQLSLGAPGLERWVKVTRRRMFVRRWSAWCCTRGAEGTARTAALPNCGRAAFAAPSMLRVHFLRQLSNLSDPAMEEVLTDIPLFREFAGIDIGEDVAPHESTILRFRHLLEAHGMMFDSATRGNAEKGLADTVVGTSANVNDVTQAHALLHGEEADAFADAGYEG